MLKGNRANGLLRADQHEWLKQLQDQTRILYEQLDAARESRIEGTTAEAITPTAKRYGCMAFLSAIAFICP